MLIIEDVQSYSTNRTVAPIREPVSTAEAIRHLRLDGVVDVDSENTHNSTDFTNTTDPLTVSSAVTNYGKITFVSGLLLKIGSEIMEVTNVSGNNVTFQRGVLGTPIVSHASGATRIFISTPEEDDIRLSVITAREYAEECQWSALMTQTWALRMDRFPPDEITIPKQPLSSITSVAYNDTAGDSQTLTAVTDYTVDTNSIPGRIVPSWSNTWPTTRGHIDDVTVTFVAGYGDETAVPQRIKHAIKLMVEDWYWNRGPEGGITNKLKTTVDRLLDFDNFRGVLG